MMDAIFAESGLANRVCLPQGLGSHCSEVDVTVTSRDSIRVATSDLDADGDLDAVFANYATPSRVCFGNGTGGFSTCSDVGTHARFSLAVAVGDLDRDGDLDVVVANYREEGNSVCLGDGAAGVSARRPGRKQE